MQVIKQGYLFKKGKINTAHKKRWFALLSTRKLVYFGSKYDINPISTIDLSTIHAINVYQPQTESLTTIYTPPTTTTKKLVNIKNSCLKSSSYEYSFELVTNSRTYILSCNNSMHCRQWLFHLKCQIFGKIIIEGYLYKKGKAWIKRYFTIYERSPNYMYFYADIKQTKPDGKIFLKSISNIHAHKFPTTDDLNFDGDYDDVHLNFMFKCIPGMNNNYNYSSSEDDIFDAILDGYESTCSVPIMPSSSVVLKMSKKRSLTNSLLNLAPKIFINNSSVSSDGKLSDNQPLFAFELVSNERKWILGTNTMEVNERWILGLKQIIFRQKNYEIECYCVNTSDMFGPPEPKRKPLLIPLRAHSFFPSSTTMFSMNNFRPRNHSFSHSSCTSPSVTESKTPSLVLESPSVSTALPLIQSETSIFYVPMATNERLRSIDESMTDGDFEQIISRVRNSYLIEKKGLPVPDFKRIVFREEFLIILTDDGIDDDTKEECEEFPPKLVLNQTCSNSSYFGVEHVLHISNIQTRTRTSAITQKL